MYKSLHVSMKKSSRKVSNPVKDLQVQKAIIPILPLDMWKLIAAYLSNNTDLSSFALVCKQFSAVAKEIRDKIPITFSFVQLKNLQIFEQKIGKYPKMQHLAKRTVILCDKSKSFSCAKIEAFGQKLPSSSVVKKIVLHNNSEVPLISLGLENCVQDRLDIEIPNLIEYGKAWFTVQAWIRLLDADPDERKIKKFKSKVYINKEKLARFESLYQLEYLRMINIL